MVALLRCLGYWALFVAGDALRRNSKRHASKAHASFGGAEGEREQEWLTSEFNQQCTQPDDEGRRRCPFLVNATVKGSMTLADWEAYEMTMGVSNLELVQVHDAVQRKASWTVSLLGPVLGIALGVASSSVNTQIKEGQATVLEQAAAALENYSDFLQDVGDAMIQALNDTLPNGQVSFTPPATAVVREINTSRAGGCDKAAQIEIQNGAGGTFWLQNWENMAVARTHHEGSDCESVWTLECHTEKLVEIMYCPLQAPQTIEHCMPSWSCWRSYNNIDHPWNGTMRLRLPGQDNWVLADAGSWVKISVVSSWSVPQDAPVIDGSTPFGGTVDPSSEGKVLTYMLPEFTAALADRYCVDWACRVAVTQSLSLLDLRTTIDTSGTLLGAMPLRLMTEGDTAIVKIKLDMEDLAAYLKYYIMQEGLEVAGYVLEGVEVRLGGAGSQVGMAMDLQLSSYVTVGGGWR